MILFEHKVIKDWTWQDLHKKIIQVVYHAANPECLEPESLAFYDIESNEIYYYDDMQLRGG